VNTKTIDTRPCTIKAAAGVRARMHPAAARKNIPPLRHRVEHARASEDVAVDPSQRGDHHHGGREVGAARPAAPARCLRSPAARRDLV